MVGELVEVRGRSDRWRFAVGGVWAMLSLRVVGGRPRLAPPSALLGAVATAALTAVVLLRRVPGEGGLSRAFAVFLAAVVATCLWLAVSAPRPVRANRLEPYVGVGAALVYAGGLVLFRVGLSGVVGASDDFLAPVVVLGLFWGLWLVYGPAVAPRRGADHR